MKMVAIPILNSGMADVDATAAAVKQNLENLTGQTRNTVQLKPLASTATTAEIITRLNALLDRLQG